MKKTLPLICGAALALLASGSVWADGTRTGQLPAPDNKFVQDAVAGGRTEVQLGQLASQKAANPAVREFGMRMEQDHSRANQQLTRILTQQGITEPTAMGKTTRSTGRLESLNGPEFDRAYMRAMVKDHKNDIAEFQKEAANGRDPGIRDWAAQSLPLLKEHLHMAEQTEANLPK
jgi:putative membrane protein